MKKEIYPLSGKGKVIKYEVINNNYEIEWSTLKFLISTLDIQTILTDFFKDESKWYILGASITNPVKGGLGEYIKNSLNFSSERYASAIAAIMENEKMICSKGIRPIQLKKI